MEHVIRNIEDLHPPSDVFNSMVENANRVYGSGNDSEDIVVALRGDENLARVSTLLIRSDLDACTDLCSMFRLEDCPW